MPIIEATLEIAKSSKEFFESRTSIQSDTIGTVSR